MTTTDWIKLPFINKSEVCRRLYGVSDRSIASVFLKKLATEKEGKDRGYQKFSKEEITKLAEIKIEFLKEMED